MLGHFVVCSDSMILSDRSVVGIVIESFGDRHRVCWNKGGTGWCHSDELLSLTKRSERCQKQGLV